jgi:hypothetical protein
MAADNLKDFLRIRFLNCLKMENIFYNEKDKVLKISDFLPSYLKHKKSK